MKGIKAITISVLFIVSCYPATAQTALNDRLSEVIRKGRMVIATNFDYPPQSEFIEDLKRSPDTKCLSNEYFSEQSSGFDVDVAKETAKRLGVEPCFVTPPWSEIVGGRWGDRWDIAFASVSITTERLEFLYFGSPYLSEPSAFYVHETNRTFRHPADLSGKRIGVCAGCTFEYYLEKTLMLPGQEIKYIVNNPHIVAYDIETNNFAELAVGDGVRIDAVMANVLIGNRAIADGMPIRKLGEPVFYTYIAPAVDKKQNRNPIPFIKKINQIIRQMHDDGTLSGLAEKYFHLETDVIAPARKFDIGSLGRYRQ